MPLPESTAREPIHERRIECHGYRRSDGLFEMDGHLVDAKSYAFENRWRGTVEAGDPVHEMWVRLTLDDRFVVREAVAATDKHPFPTCPDITPDYGALVGLQIGPGWTRKTRELLAGAKGCTHLNKLLEVMAAAAIQTIGPLLKDHGVVTDRKPPQIDGCHVLRSDGEVVREHYPRWYRQAD